MVETCYRPRSQYLLLVVRIILFVFILGAPPLLLSLMGSGAVRLGARLNSPLLSKALSHCLLQAGVRGLIHRSASAIIELQARCGGFVRLQARAGGFVR